MRLHFICFLNIPAGGSPINRRSLRREYFKKSNPKRVAP